jgi:hypothetical protein
MHAILATQEAETGSLFKARLGKKFSIQETSSQPIKAGCGGMCLSTRLHRKQEDGGPGQPRQKARHYLKNNKSKKACGREWVK